MGFWDYIEKENERKRAEQYVDDPNQISWTSLAFGLVFFLFFFVFCPSLDKKGHSDSVKWKKNCYNDFYTYSLYGIVKGKKYIQSKRTHLLTLDLMDSSKIEEVACKCDNLYEIYTNVEIGDTILKPADTLLVKIYNSPKYEELNRYETFKEKY